jgi:hypothetical protein
MADPLGESSLLCSGFCTGYQGIMRIRKSEIPMPSTAADQCLPSRTKRKSHLGLVSSVYDRERTIPLPLMLLHRGSS